MIELREVGPITALTKARVCGDLSIAKFLITTGADIYGRESISCSRMVLASMPGTEEDERSVTGRLLSVNQISARRMLDAGCDMELLDDDGETAHLCCMCTTADRGTIELLLDRGTDATTKNKQSETGRTILKLSEEYFEPDNEAGLKRIVERLPESERPSSFLVTISPWENKLNPSWQTISHKSTQLLRARQNHCYSQLVIHKRQNKDIIPDFLCAC